MLNITADKTIIKLEVVHKCMFVRNSVRIQKGRIAIELQLSTLPQTHTPTHSLLFSSNPLINLCKFPIDLDKNLLCN